MPTEYDTSRIEQLDDEKWPKEMSIKREELAGWVKEIEATYVSTPPSENPQQEPLNAQTAVA